MKFSLVKLSSLEVLTNGDKTDELSDKVYGDLEYDEATNSVRVVKTGDLFPWARVRRAVFIPPEFNCDQCDGAFYSAANLGSHKSFVHGIPGARQGKGKK